jgi:hypothetical protein
MNNAFVLLSMPSAKFKEIQDLKLLIRKYPYFVQKDPFKSISLKTSSLRVFFIDELDTP